MREITHFYIGFLVHSLHSTMGRGLISVDGLMIIMRAGLLTNTNRL